MKVASLLLTLGLAPLLAAQQAALTPGKDVTPQALERADWIQGSAPVSWKDGELYVIECWATWCGPCLAAIPHLNELHQKYADKGLRVMGLSVWEDDVAKVREFVKGKGDGMSYPVAFAGREGPFVVSWLQAAGVRGIPHTFVVQDGKLLFTTHPMQLTEELIEKILAGGDGARDAVASLNRQRELQEKMRPLLRDMQVASAKSDAAAMTTTLAKIEELDPDLPQLPMLRLELDIAKDDWEAAAGRLDKMEGAQAVRTVTSFGYRVLQDSAEYPEPFRKNVAATLDRLFANESDRDSFACVILACLRMSLGDREKAIAAAKLAAESAGDEVPREPLDRFASELENGNSPSPDDVLGWVRQAMQDKRAHDGQAEQE